MGEGGIVNTNWILDNLKEQLGNSRCDDLFFLKHLSFRDKNGNIYG